MSIPQSKWECPALNFNPGPGARVVSTRSFLDEIKRLRIEDNPRSRTNQDTAKQIQCCESGGELLSLGRSQIHAMKNLKLWFCAAVLLLAVFQFSENTVDPDLWGHVVFGQHMLQSHSIPKTDIYSWTANGQPWINHEWVAEIILALFYTAWGGSGILLLKMAVGLAAFAVCLRLGAQSLSWPARFVAWGFAALAVVEISYGFAARPQIFTALFMSLELLLLQQIHSGKRLWALALPVLFLVWVNTHGGVLAGFGLLGLAAGATTVQLVWNKIRKSPGRISSQRIRRQTAD